MLPIGYCGKVAYVVIKRITVYVVNNITFWNSSVEKFVDSTMKQFLMEFAVFLPLAIIIVWMFAFSITLVNVSVKLGIKHSVCFVILYLHNSWIFYKNNTFLFDTQVNNAKSMFSKTGNVTFFYVDDLTYFAQYFP